MTTTDPAQGTLDDARHCPTCGADRLLAPCGHRVPSEAERLLLAMAGISPIADDGGCFWCGYDERHPHADNCAWLATRAYLAGRSLLPAPTTETP